MKGILMLFFLGNCFLLGIAGYSQTFGGNRSGIRWRQIDADTVRVIFPTGLDASAQRVATISSYLAHQQFSTIGSKLKKINIVLQAENTISNGYVGLAPFRSEFYLTPLQNPLALGANHWPDMLAIHEFRHVQQFNNFNVGLSKLGNIIAGQQGRAVFNNIAIPDWFWEGDAVYNETKLTNQGRGRLPSFFNGYKSVYLQNRQYSWMKMRNGSLRSLVPNHYQLGYLLVAYGRQQYGDSVWAAITKDAAAFKGLFYPMQTALKHHLGINYRSFLQNAKTYYSTQWKDQATFQPKWITSIQKNAVVDYQFPYPMGNGSFVVLKAGFRQIPTFYKIDSLGVEEKIAVKDISTDNYYSYRKGRIIYSAYRTDARWGNRDFSDIKILDVKTKAVQTITHHGRYFSPDLQPNGSLITAVSLVPSKPCQLHVLDIKGNVLKKLDADSGLVFSHPKWLDNQEQVLIAARTKQGAMGWLLWTIENGQTRWLLPLGHRMLAFPVVQNDTVVFTQSSGGSDFLVAMDIHSGKCANITNWPTGVYQGFLENGHVVAAVFTADGYRIGKWPALNQSISNREDALPIMQGLSVLKSGRNLNDLPSSTYKITAYKKSFQLFNFHSWQPEFNEPNYSFRLLGENILSTLSSEVAYTYNTNERSNALETQFIYGGSWVQPTANLKQTWQREINLNKDTTLVYNELEAGFGFRVPLNFTAGKQIRSLSFSSTFNHQQVRWQGFAQGKFRNLDFNYINTRLVYTGQIQQATQHIFPRWAQTLVLDYNTIVNQYTAKQFLGSGNLYLPGLFRNQHLVLSAAYQARDTMQQYVFSNSFPFSRGYNNINFPRMWRMGVNYHFPICYPDWGAAGIFYIRRLRANLFYDYTLGKSLRTGTVYNFGTAGGEVYFDMKFLNVQTATLGIRYSYLLDNNLLDPNRIGRWELILPVNIFE